MSRAGECKKRRVSRVGECEKRRVGGVRREGGVGGARGGWSETQGGRVKRVGQGWVGSEAGSRARAQAGARTGAVRSSWSSSRIKLVSTSRPAPSAGCARTSASCLSKHHQVVWCGCARGPVGCLTLSVTRKTRCRVSFSQGASAPGVALALRAPAALALTPLIGSDYRVGSGRSRSAAVSAAASAGRGLLPFPLLVRLLLHLRLRLRLRLRSRSLPVYLSRRWLRRRGRCRRLLLVWRRCC